MSNAPQNTDYLALVEAAVVDKASFIRLTLSGQQRGAKTPWLKAFVRPVEIKKGRCLQITCRDRTRDVSKTYAPAQALEHLRELLALPFSRIHVQATTGDLHMRIGKRGQVMVRRGKPSLPKSPQAFPHDRVKKQPLTRETSTEFMQALGLAGANGRIRANKYDKFRQINEFIALMHQAVAPILEPAKLLRIVDCGCGNAYLTFAARHFLADVLGQRVHVIGIDRDEDRIAHCRELKERLRWDGIEFRRSDIAAYTPPAPPDVVLSLHACDTATDEALAQAVRWESSIILCAPCCQHELRGQVDNPAFRPVLRHGILGQRTADILTDACRAQILRILGYRAEVVEFIDSEHTPKNLMIRAQRTLKPGPPEAAREYLVLKKEWNIQPALEMLLADVLNSYLKAQA